MFSSSAKDNDRVRWIHGDCFFMFIKNLEVIGATLLRMVAHQKTYYYFLHELLNWATYSSYELDGLF